MVETLKITGFHHQLAQDFTGPSTVSWNVLYPQSDLVDLPPSSGFFPLGKCENH
jgi:hypothetical protein